MLKAHHRQYFAAFLFDFSIVCGLTVTPFYIFHHLGGGAAMSGVVTGAQWALYTLVCLASAPHVSRARNGLAWALVGAAGFAVLFPLGCLVRNAYFFGALTSAALALTGLFWPAMQSWIGAEPNLAVRTRRMSHYNIAWTVGLTLAPLFAGPLYDRDYRLPFILVFATAIGALLLVATLPHEPKHSGKAAEHLDAAHGEHGRQSEVHLYATWCSLLVGSALISAMGAVFPKRMEELFALHQLRGIELIEGLLHRVSAAPAKAATYFAVLAVMMYALRAGASLVMGWVDAWRHRFWVLAAFQVGAGVAFWVLARTDSLAIMAPACLVVGAACGVVFFASQSYSVANSPLRHRRLAIHESMVGIGSLLGAIAYGLLAERFGASWPFEHTPLFVAAGLIAQAVLLRLGMKRQDNREV